MSKRPGFIILFGSGETAPSGQKVFDWLFRQMTTGLRMAILETPAGFELNSPAVAGRIGDFVQHSLQNYRPQVTIVPARKRGTPHSPDDPEIAERIHGADVIFLGPGSPTYTVRQLQDSLTWQTLVALHRFGASVVLASAAAIAAGAYALPVYEIYKAGEDLHWREGLDLLEPYGLSVVFIPHWNNQEGGVGLDTSHCYMGQARFDPLLKLLPSTVTVVGIDEHTALAMDLAGETCRVMGKDSVTVLRDGQAQRFGSGERFCVQALGPFRRPEDPAGIPADVWTRVRKTQKRVASGRQPSAEVLDLAEKREAARSRRDWDTADALRERAADLGWQIKDTREGWELEPL